MDKIEHKNLPFLGKTLSRIEHHQEDDGDYINFFTTEGDVFQMAHDQSCCEKVVLEEVIGGTLQDLVGSEILIARETTQEAYKDPRFCDDMEMDYASSLWAFYTIATMYTTIVLRWENDNKWYAVNVETYNLRTSSPPPAPPYEK